MTAYDDMIDDELADTLEAERHRKRVRTVPPPSQDDIEALEQHILSLREELSAERRLRVAAEENAKNFHALLIEARVNLIKAKR